MNVASKVMKRKDQILLSQCRGAKTLEEQRRCFEELAEFLETLETRNPEKNTDDDGNSTLGVEDDIGVLSARENISRTVLTLWPYGQATASIDRILDGCGPMVSISTCSSILKEISAADHSNQWESDELSSFPTSIWTPSSSSLPLRSIVEACWAIIQRTLLAVSPQQPNNTKRDTNHDGRKPLEMQRFVSKIVLLLPQALANACHAVKLRVPLHGTPTYFFPRLIYFAWMQIQSHHARTKPATPLKHWDFQQQLSDDGVLSLSVLYAKILITQLLHNRRSEQVVSGLMRQFVRNGNKNHHFSSHNEDENNKSDHGNETDYESETLSSFLTSLELVPRDLASLILALLQYANTVERDRVAGRRARKICHSLFHSSSIEHQETIVEQMCFSKNASFSGYRSTSVVGKDQQQRIQEKNQRRWSGWVAETIAPPPISSGTIEDTCVTAFSKHLTSIADRWSQLTFVHEVDGQQQRHVSVVLWRGLVILECLKVSLQHLSQRNLTAALVGGVSHRLGSVFPTLRQDAMQIAQQLARGLGQDSVRFDEFIVEGDIGDDWHDVFSDDRKNNSCIKNEKETAKKNDNIRLKKEDQSSFDPDADYDSDTDGEVDSVSVTNDMGIHLSGNEGLVEDNGVDSPDDDEQSVEWEDELIPYDLEDDEEDLRETPRPLNLLEALDLLRTGENHDHAFTRHEAALEALPSLIRGRPDNLTDVAVSLALELLRMEDKFDIQNFNIKRESAIRGLLIEEPLLVGQQLIEQIFEESGLADKLSILASLQSAAFELSGSSVGSKSAINSSSSKTTDLTPGQHGDDRSTSTANQVARVLSKTRRKRSRTQNKSIQNRFANVAPIWFYSLIACFLKHREDEILWTGSTGSILLAYFFRCLATIVEFSGFQGSQVLANDLLDFVWDFRTADVPEVRLSALVAVSTSIAMLSDEKLTSLIFDENHLSQTIYEMSRKDPDEDCRSLCQTMSFSIRQLLNSSF